ncbi:MAG: glycogen/starch/alpha-glucan phosphorylase [Provencibacterium sp.]|jgi:starch phosphorylase|nr:glycogen/starch/alpha-glucan phosphorylase [Provencibacterium sp.]
MDKQAFLKTVKDRLLQDDGCTLSQAAPWQLHNALSHALMGLIASDWQADGKARCEKKQACYFSAEFLMGRAVYNNLLSLGLMGEIKQLLQENGVSLESLEEIEDAALGNGGLGRLAACFLDSAATCGLPLDGYGIRYRYGLFRQTIEEGYQREYADDWTRHGDPWSIRREQEAVWVRFADQTVRAVPYDMPVIGYGRRSIGTLRLWQAEPETPFDFELFNEQDYDAAMHEKNMAENISRVLYPNDTTREGKILRLKQQYFFCSASLQHLLRQCRAAHGSARAFSDYYAVQLNDTHPVVSIPELIRLLMDEEGLSFNEAFGIAEKVFSYTNHTIMAEALEKWEVSLLRAVCPRIFEIILMIDERLSRLLAEKKVPLGERRLYRIVDRGMVHMARLAIFAGHATNGVAKIHTEIVKYSALPEWYRLFPERFQNKTNGITQRRWLLLCNPQLSEMVTRLTGSEEWVTNLDKLKSLECFADDHAVLEDFLRVKQEKKRELSAYIAKHEGIELPEHFIFDIQVKRLHEYKRQLLNAFAILDIYYGLKEGRIRDFTPTAFIFGAKSAPGYVRAKAIIHYICEIARLINNDPAVSDRMKVVFVQNYNVSYAEKLVCAADVSEQISTAGTEASGTSNMKFMLNGTVTLGTYDGANIEIVAAAGEQNNYIFGARVEELEQLKESYNPRKIYESDPRIHRVLDTLVDGTFKDSGSGEFRELYTSLLDGASWHKPDHYFLLQDFHSYVDTRLRLYRDYNDRMAFAKKCWMNMANAGQFSSDRTIRQYADEIWDIAPVER